MRRSFRPTFKPQKQFIHTYHINEVPLPYYNPYQDPNLKHYFSNSKVVKQITQNGFRYDPRRQYPYLERRAKNAYRFHRQNSPQTPATHMLRDSKRGFSQSLFLNKKADASFYEAQEQCSPMANRNARSQVLNDTGKIMFLAQIKTQKAKTQVRKKMIYSSEGKNKMDWLNQKRAFSSSRNSQIIDPEKNF